TSIQLGEATLKSSKKTGNAASLLASLAPALPAEPAAPLCPDCPASPLASSEPPAPPNAPLPPQPSPPWPDEASLPASGRDSTSATDTRHPPAKSAASSEPTQRIPGSYLAF